MILVISSNEDIASLNIKHQILNHYPFKEGTQSFQQKPIYTADSNGQSIQLVTLSEQLINAQHLPQYFPEAKLIVFISRHSSASGKPTLSVHTPGNFGSAELGGLPRTISVSPGGAMQNALKALNECKEQFGLSYEVSYECTHHGPSLNVPSMFVELGSSETQWKDSTAAEAVAHATMAAIAKFSKSADSAVLGIGGPHYNEKFTRMALASEAVFGHIIPKYAVSIVDAEILAQCIRKTLEKVSLAILDWKGIRSKDKSKLLSALKEVALDSKKV